MTTSSPSNDRDTQSNNQTVPQRKEKFLDQFLASVSSFPSFLDHKLARIRDLDQQCVMKVRALDEHSKQHIAAIRAKWAASNSSASQSSSSPVQIDTPVSIIARTAASTQPTMTELFGTGSQYDIDAAETKLRADQAEISALNKDKLKISCELYDSMDGHVRRLDSSLKKYESKLRKGGFEISAAPIDRRRPVKRVLDADGRLVALTHAAEMRDELDKATSSVSVNHESEPVYCTCRKVSYGAMVACDNEDCETEWFHFACMGLESKPRGKWYCPDCRKKMTVKKKKDK